MRDVLRMVGILTLVTLVSGGVLSVVNNKTRPKIEAQRRAALQQALYLALPGTKEGVIVPHFEGGRVSYYCGYASKDTTCLIGYAFLAEGKGYSSTIETIVGVDTTGVIQGIKILHQLETPGLGSKIEEIRYGEEKPWFQAQFVGKRAEELAVDKDGGGIKSITGATISSRAVTNSIKEGLLKLEEKLSGFCHK